MNASAPLEPASLWRRVASLVYDVLVLAALVLAFTAAAVALRGFRTVAPAVLWVGVVTITVLFYGWFWTHGGQTVGMRAWRIRVLAADGGPLGWRRAAMRFAAAWLAALPLGLGYWWALLDREGRCWHDRLSRTRVVRLR